MEACHRPLKTLRDVPSSSVSQQRWELDPGTGNLMPMARGAVGS